MERRRPDISPRFGTPVSTPSGTTPSLNSTASYNGTKSSNHERILGAVLGTFSFILFASLLAYLLFRHRRAIRRRQDLVDFVVLPSRHVVISPTKFEEARTESPSPEFWDYTTSFAPPVSNVCRTPFTIRDSTGSASSSEDGCVGHRPTSPEEMDSVEERSVSEYGGEVNTETTLISSTPAPSQHQVNNSSFQTLRMKTFSVIARKGTERTIATLGAPPVETVPAGSSFTRVLAAANSSKRALARLLPDIKIPDAMNQPDEGNVPVHRR